MLNCCNGLVYLNFKKYKGKTNENGNRKDSERTIDLGMKPEEISNWCSDLYVKVTEISENFVKTYQYKSIVTTFISNYDKTLWYELPFAYTENYYKK